MFSNVKVYLFGLALAAVALQMSDFFGYMTDTVEESGDPSVDLAPTAAGSPFNCSLGPVVTSSTHLAKCDSYVIAVGGSESHAHVFLWYRHASH